MKAYYLLLLISLLSFGCTSIQYIQLFETASTNTELKNDIYVYETDSIRISYAFWTENGVLAIEIFNKLEKPIYIDWKNSSFIYNDRKYDYWIDESKTDSKEYYGTYLYGGIVQNIFGLSTNTMTTSRPERITFIPPKANYYRTQFYLYPYNHFTFSNYNWTTTPRNDDPDKMTTVYYKDFSISNSPIRFRNYLAFSMSETSQSYFYIDNGFFVKSAKEMDIRNFKKETYNAKLAKIVSEEYYFRKGTSFYIHIPSDKSIEESGKQKDR